MSENYSRAAFDVLGLIKKWTVNQLNHQPSAQQTFPLQHGVQLEFDFPDERRYPKTARRAKR
jgi:hypothetical protein